MGEANDERAECSWFSRQGSRNSSGNPTSRRLRCYPLLMFQQPGGVMNAGRRGREWRWPHCPGAISGIGQPLATSQSPGWVSISPSTGCPYPVSISPSITVEHLLTIDTAGTPHPSPQHQPILLLLDSSNNMQHSLNRTLTILMKMKVSLWK